MFTCFIKWLSWYLYQMINLFFFSFFNDAHYLQWINIFKVRIDNEYFFHEFSRYSSFILYQIAAWIPLCIWWSSDICAPFLRSLFFNKIFRYMAILSYVHWRSGYNLAEYRENSLRIGQNNVSKKKEPQKRATDI
jgi:hypothetical protein